MNLDPLKSTTPWSRAFRALLPALCALLVLPAVHAQPNPVLAVDSGTGLLGQYFVNKNLAGTPALVRTEAPWFNWGYGAPAPRLPSDNFSVRWTGQVQAIEAGSYQFRTFADDGVRVWVDGQLIISDWSVHPARANTSAGVKLTAGQRVSIVVEYFEAAGDAKMQLAWLRPGRGWEPLHAEQLYPGVPEAAFSYEASQLALLFDAGTTQAVRDVKSYDWDFGDGSKGSGKLVPHAYAAAGF